MGRQAYLNRLALGRSPYEAPESTGTDLSGATQQGVSHLHGDGYVQQYDDRGHPINTGSRALGKGLRRAKNDILSTMGIVVSGKDPNAIISNEQHNIDIITAENDYGLIMATLDQVLVFLGSWWATSLASRIQTFKHYTQFPLLSIMSHERASVGTLGFYFAGIPAWALSTSASICRHQPLERFVAFLQESLLYLSPNNILAHLIRASCFAFHSVIKETLLIVAIQSYIHSLLQSLQLVHSRSFPGLWLLVPSWGRLHLPPVPADLSLRAMSSFGLGLLASPSILVYFSLYFRPMVEMRLYRLIRRRLPKPTNADETSIRVALDNGLIDWMVPSLGRGSEEEISRSRLTLAEDIINEFQALKAWISCWFGFEKQKQGSALGANDTQSDQGTEPLHHHVGELRSDLIAEQSHAHRAQQQLADTRDILESRAVAIRAGLFDQDAPTPAFLSDHGVDIPESLASGRSRISRSSDEMITSGLAEVAPLRQARPIPPVQFANTQPDGDNSTRLNRRNSRTNTLFSHPSSPESSPPTSPRVRASLIHQNSEIITMQLELLSHHNPQGRTLPTARGDGESQTLDHNVPPAGQQAVAEFLDNFISAQGQDLTRLATSSATEFDDRSGLTAGVSYAVSDNIPPRAIARNDGQNTTTEDSTPDSRTPSALVTDAPPDTMEGVQSERAHTQLGADPTFDNTALLEPLCHSTSSQGPSSNDRGGPHRVTILSSHPLDSLASHLASVITGLMFLPFDSLYLRTLAFSHLSRTASPALSDIRELSLLHGERSIVSTLSYTGKLFLVYGMQAAVSASVWGAITGVAIRIGKSFCGWGKL